MATICHLDVFSVGALLSLAGLVYPARPGNLGQLPPRFYQQSEKLHFNERERGPTLYVRKEDGGRGILKTFENKYVKCLHGS